MIGGAASSVRGMRESTCEWAAQPGFAGPRKRGRASARAWAASAHRWAARQAGASEGEKGTARVAHFVFLFQKCEIVTVLFISL
jgi:hypothetical protein